jgi:hypothetical protein
MDDLSLRRSLPRRVLKQEVGRIAVNFKTAKAIGVTLPTSILLRSDEVIE